MRTDIRYIKMTTEKVTNLIGGSAGIGRATAIALAKEGVKIAVVARCAKLLY